MGVDVRRPLLPDPDLTLAEDAELTDERVDTVETGDRVLGSGIVYGQWWTQLQLFVNLLLSICEIFHGKLKTSSPSCRGKGKKCPI